MMFGPATPWIALAIALLMMWCWRKTIFWHKRVQKILAGRLYTTGRIRKWWQFRKDVRNAWGIGTTLNGLVLIGIAFPIMWKVMAVIGTTLIILLVVEHVGTPPILRHIGGGRKGAT